MRRISRRALFIKTLLLLFFLLLPSQPVAYQRRCPRSPSLQPLLIHATTATVEWARLFAARDARYRPGHTCTDFLACFWNSLTDACVCWHCVACIALPQADANTLFSSSTRPTAGIWRRTLCALRSPACVSDTSPFFLLNAPLCYFATVILCGYRGHSHRSASPI
jgi:hypothetical protein